MWFRASTAGRRAGGTRRLHGAPAAMAARGPRQRAARRPSRRCGPRSPACIEGDWIGAHQALMHHFATRRPRFVLDPAARSERVRTILEHHPDARADAVRRGDRVAAGQFDLLGYRGLTFGNGREPADDRLAPRSRAPAARAAGVLEPGSLSRARLRRPQSRLGAQSSPVVADARTGVLADGRPSAIAMRSSRTSTAGCGRNPPLTGVNWASMLELSLRSISWLWALHFFVQEGPRAAASRSVAVDRRSACSGSIGSCARRAESLALLQPEYPSARRGARPLRRRPRVARVAPRRGVGATGSARCSSNRSRRQIDADGGHAELSTHYHRYTLDFYLLALARRPTDRRPAGARLRSSSPSAWRDMPAR